MVVPNSVLFSSFDCYYTTFSERKKHLSFNPSNFTYFLVLSIKKQTSNEICIFIAQLDEELLLELESPPPMYWVKMFWKAWSLTLMFAACNSLPITP